MLTAATESWFPRTRWREWLANLFGDWTIDCPNDNAGKWKLKDNGKWSLGGVDGVASREVCCCPNDSVDVTLSGVSGACAPECYGNVGWSALGSPVGNDVLVSNPTSPNGTYTMLYNRYTTGTVADYYGYAICTYLLPQSTVMYAIDVSVKEKDELGFGDPPNDCSEDARCEYTTNAINSSVIHPNVATRVDVYRSDHSIRRVDINSMINTLCGGCTNNTPHYDYYPPPEYLYDPFAPAYYNTYDMDSWFGEQVFDSGVLAKGAYAVDDAIPNAMVLVGDPPECSNLPGQYLFYGGTATVTFS